MPFRIQLPPPCRSVYAVVARPQAPAESAARLLAQPHPWLDWQPRRQLASPAQLPYLNGSVESLTPGVTVVSVDEEAGIIDIDIPNDTQNVLLRYTPAGSGGLGAQVVVAGTSMAAYPTGNYVIVKSRSPDPKQTGTAADPETGSNLCLMPKHYILMPTAACTGVDDNSAQCTGAASKAVWDGAVRHGYGNGAGDLGFGSSDWAVMINAPDERGQHLMHIHVAPLVPATSSKILIAAKQATNMQTVLTKDPTVITAGGHTVAAYFFKEASTPPKVAVDVYGTAAAIHIKYARLRSLNANDVAYGVALITKPGGFVVAATYGFADVNVMDTTIANSPVARFCRAACAPFK
ncbi:hypothetical protein OEZ85_010020 [Tetradesmus obliquus]|uniref:CDP-diacylglycerol diphosphatase n=1 Tax=Tetradesmus obliquus TaxID=3088 RepID=A0ABY8UAT8_TETOB|nr:hypothetical protein OEZ85_010020 [Tetradesmus obliquus]